MYKFFAVTSMLFLLAGIAGADMTQSAWYNGGGVPGPVFNWYFANFYQSSDLCFWSSSWSSSSGHIKLRLSLAESTQIDVSDDDPISVFSSDIDGDGDEDVIALFGYMGGTQQVLWWENLDGAGSSWSEHIIDVGFSSGQNVVSSDIDGNGTMDVVAANRDENICWWSNTDGTGTLWEEHLACEKADWVECADMDGDGDTDFALASWWFDTVLWCENIDGIGETWLDHEIADNIMGAICGNPCDINSDGYLDFIGLACNSSKLYWWENEDGTGTTWTEHVISTSVVQPQAMHAGDMDGDGDFDVAVVSGDGDDVVWFRNEDGLGGVWTEVLVTHVPYTASKFLFDVHTSDLDADGDLDICSLVHCTGGWIFWCENLDGIGESWAVHTFAPAINSAWSVHPSDINGDGKNDLVTCLLVNGQIEWWDLNEDGYSPDGYLESSILDTDVISPDYQTLTWESEVPPETTLNLQIRASDDYNDMGDWSEPLYTSPVQVDEVVGNGEKYFQYRVNMETTDPLATPWFAWLELTWNELGIEEGGLEDMGILSVSSNPLLGLASVALTCDYPMNMEFSVYDLSGRRVFNVPGKRYEAGVSTVDILNIPPGIYICTLNGEDFHENFRFVLTE
ncbi:MAG: T9SS type A sorting domain-containing protein [Candidatus Sabulitectum sp.]|nr:T9SS type A sorting domain-containing protein [Candidatus Sabulitectum sp.]